MTTSWCIVPVPTRSWAELVYPELDGEAAYEKLWEDVGAHLPPRDRRSVRRVDRALERAEGERAAPHRPPLRRAPAARSGHRPHDRPLPFGALGGRRPRDRRRAAALPEHPDRGAVRHPRPRSCRRPRVARRCRSSSRARSSAGIRVEFDGGRAVKIDADEGAEALRAVAARDDGASRLGEIALVDGDGRIGPLGTRVLRHADRRERRQPHRSRRRLRASRRGPCGAGAHQQERDARRLHDREPGARGRRDHARRRAPFPCFAAAPGRSERALKELRRAGFRDLERGARGARLASSPRSSRRGSAARLSRPNTRSNSGVVR